MYEIMHKRFFNGFIKMNILLSQAYYVNKVKDILEVRHV